MIKTEVISMIKAGIIGATGYAGVELVRLLLGHPDFEIAAISSVSFEGKPLSSVYPALRELCDRPCESAEAVVEKSELVFAALPHGLSQETAAACDAADKKFIDLGADFRLDDPDVYQQWYGCEALYPALHKKAVYGLPELFREKIKQTTLIGNPGCYPTSVALGLGPRPARGIRRNGRTRHRFQVGYDRRGPRPLPDHPFPGLQRGVFRL